MRGILLDFLAAFGAWVFVKSGVDVSNAQLGLQVPVLSQNPGIAIRKTATHISALVAVVGEFRKVGAEKFYSVFQVAEVVFATVGMYADEMARETFAEPVSSLGLHQPVLPFTVV